MTDAQFALISKAVADPSRLAMLQLIGQGETSCLAIREHLGVTPATISHHVRELTGAGLVHERKEAKLLMLRLNRVVWRHYLAELARRVPPAR